MIRILFATLLLASASTAVLAQGASPTVAPMGGAASTTAPSNSEGTPAGGTGALATTRTEAAPTARATPARRHVARRAHRSVKPAAAARSAS